MDCCVNGGVHIHNRQVCGWNRVGVENYNRIIELWDTHRPTLVGSYKLELEGVAACVSAYKFRNKVMAHLRRKEQEAPTQRAISINFQ